MDFDKLMQINVERLQELFERNHVNPASMTKWSYGYIGNTNFAPVKSPAFFDDRSWMIFTPHPNYRPGGYNDHIGGYSTDKRFRLFFDLMPLLKAL